MALNLVDSSVWIDFLRGRKTPARDALRDLMHSPDKLATTEPVAMELRAGSRGAGLVRVDRALSSLTLLGVDPRIDFHQAADLFRAVRLNGHTVRSMIDCLIAAVAMRRHAVLVHKDCDFDLIAEVAPQLTVRSVDG